MTRTIPIIIVVILVILNVLVQGMGFMGKGFTTPENEIWRGPVMPGKQLTLPDPKMARVVGQLHEQPSETKVEKGKEEPSVVKVAPVAVHIPVPIPSPPPPPSPLSSPPAAAVATGKFVVQIGSYALNLGVDSLMEQLQRAGLSPRVERVVDRVSLNHVQAGPFSKLEVAKEAEAKLKAGGFQVQVEESWEGFIIPLSKFLLLGHAFEEMERAKSLGVLMLRLVKVDADMEVRKILLGPFDTKELAMKMSVQVSALGFSAPVLKTWPLSNTLP